MADIEPIVLERIKETCSRILPSAGYAHRDARTRSNTTIECPREFKKGAPKGTYKFKVTVKGKGGKKKTTQTVKVVVK